jgi:hypothetical protein
MKEVTGNIRSITSTPAIDAHPIWNQRSVIEMHILNELDQSMFT